MVPVPVYHIPFWLPLRIVTAMPYKTLNTPPRNKISTGGISRKLCRYLYFSAVTIPVRGSAANPFDSKSEMTKNRKETRNGTVLIINLLTDLVLSESSINSVDNIQQTVYSGKE